MKKITFITTPDAEYGFSLAGITHRTGAEEDAEEMMRKMTSEPNTGLIIVDERLIKGMPEDRLREIEHVFPGIILVLPSPEKPPPEVEDYAARLIRRAIGYHVRVKL